MQYITIRRHSSGSKLVTADLLKIAEVLRVAGIEVPMMNVSVKTLAVSDNDFSRATHAIQSIGYQISAEPIILGDNAEPETYPVNKILVVVITSEGLPYYDALGSRYQMQDEWGTKYWLDADECDKAKRKMIKEYKSNMTHGDAVLKADKDIWTVWESDMQGIYQK